MIAPEDLATAILPPGGSTAHAAAAQLALADTGMALGEQLLAAVPGGRQQAAALDHLVRALQAAYAGIDPALDQPGDVQADAPVPDEVVEQPAEDVQGDPLILDVPMWRFGITTSTLHPLTRLVALVMADACGPSGYIPDAMQPTLGRLCEHTGLHIQVLHHHLGDLAAAGWVSRHATTEHGTRRTRYQLRLPATRANTR